MDEKLYYRKRTGGRPRKLEKRDQLVAIKCTAGEKKKIEELAAETNLTVSEYLREVGLKSQVVRKSKTLPPEILKFTATLNHMAANINQVAYQRNINDQLSELERVQLKILSIQIKDLANAIKSFLK